MKMLAHPFAVFGRSFAIHGFLVLLLIGFVSEGRSAQAEIGERIALVVGNAAYKAAPLANTKSDANGMANLLKNAGFTVDLQLDASQDQFRQAAARFGEQIKDPKVKFGVFYYAGHGVQLNSRNYLIPVNANIKKVGDVERQTVDVTDLLRHMEQSKDKSLIVILDACRDDPFEGAYRVSAKGLSPYNAPVGTLLAYATGPGQVASDGDGKNGLYTKYLLRELAVPGESLLDGFMRVRVGVMTESRGRQIPWELSSLIDRDLYLFPGERKKLGLAEQVQLDDRESSEWAGVRSSATLVSVDEVARFLRTYPNGISAEQAQYLLNRLWKQERDKDVGAVATAAENKRLAEEKALAGKAAAAAAEAEAQRVAALREQAKRAEVARIESERLEAERRQAMVAAAKQAEEARLADQRAIEAQLLAQAQASKAEAGKQEALRIASAREAARQMEEDRIVAARVAEQQTAAARLALERAKADQLAAERAESARLAAARQAAADEQAVKVELARLDLAKAQAEANRIAALAEQTALKASESTQASLHVAATPFFQGFDEHLRNYQVGDEYEFQIIDGLTHAAKKRKVRVTAIDVNRDRVEFNNGDQVSDLMGNNTRNERGNFDSVRQFYPAHFFVGKAWRTHFKQSRPNGVTYTFRYELKVVAKERVTVPAGTFDTYKIEARGFNMELGASLLRNIWVSPSVSADIVHETQVRLRNGQIDQYERQELVHYSTVHRGLPTT